MKVFVGVLDQDLWKESVSLVQIEAFTKKKPLNIFKTHLDTRRHNSTALFDHKKLFQKPTILFCLTKIRGILTFFFQEKLCRGRVAVNKATFSLVKKFLSGRNFFCSAEQKKLWSFAFLFSAEQKQKKTRFALFWKKLMLNEIVLIIFFHFIYRCFSFGFLYSNSCSP